MNEKTNKKPEVKPVAKAVDAKTTKATETPVVKPAETKTATVKPAETKAVEVKPVETKTAEAPKAVEKPAAKEPVKAEPVKKEVSKKKAARKPAAKKEESTTEVFVEFYGKQSAIEDVKKKIIDAFVAEGHRVSTIKSLKVYLKPEDYSAYYVINEKFAGRVDLF